MIAVFLRLFNLSVMAGWMVVAVLLLRLCLKKAPRWITCVLWGLVALRLLVPFTIESPISLIPTAATVVSGDTADTSVPVVNSGMEAIDKPLNDWLQTPVPSSPPVGNTTPDVPQEDVTPLPPVEDTPTVPDEKPTDTEEKSVSRMEQILQIAAPVWLVGIGLMLLYELLSVLRVRSRVLDAVRLRDNVWQSDRVSSPFIFGLFRPRIYVPYDLEEPMLEQVLSHEQAHLHRRDHWIKPFAFTLLAVYWYNPLLWVGYILLCRDIEVACDQRVVRGLDEDTRRQYATALLQCGVERRSIAACPLAFGEVSIKQRIKSVLNYRKPLLWVIIASLLACSVAAVCLLTVPGEEPLKVLSSQEIEPDQVRRFYGTDTDGALIEAGVDWMWQHAENPDAKTPDIDYWEETNIPLVVSRSKADLDALMDACSDETMQVDMRGSFKLEKYDDTYFEDKVIVWLFVPGYDLATYDYTVTLEETNKGLRYAVTLQYNSTSMFNPWPGRCEYLLLFETDRKTIEEADSLTTRHQRAPIQLPTEEGLTMVPVGNADLDGDGEKEEIRLYHSEFDWDSGWYEIAYLVVCKKDGTPILKEDTLVYKHSQCYLVPQDDGSSLLLFVETDGVGDGDEEEFGVLSLKDGQRTVVQCLYDGAIRLNNLELGEVIFYVSSLSDWLEKAELLYDCKNGTLFYGDTLSDTTPQYTPLCWLDTYRTNSDDTVQDILENVLDSLNGTVTPIGKMDFDQDGQADSLFVLGYTSPLDMFEACLLVRGTNGTILTTIPIHTYYNSADKLIYLYRVTDSTGKEWLQKVTLFMDGTCNVSDLSIEGAANYRSMTMTEWLNTAAKTGAKMICYLEGWELYFGDSTTTDDFSEADGNYVDYADLLKTKYSHQEIEYALRDLNADGREELLVLEQGTTLSVYAKKTGYTQLLVEQDFVSGTSRFLMTGDAAYPGLIYFCVGGGKDRYYYLSLDKVEDRQFIFTELWTDNYAFAEEGEEGRVTILSNDAKLVELSRVAYQNNQDLFSVSLPSDKTDGTTMTDAELLALCKGKIQCAQQIEGWYKGGSHYTTTIPKGTATTLLNGETYVIEYDYYPLADDFYLDGAMHSGAVITAAALKQQIESVYTTAFAHDRYYDDGYTWVVYNGDVYHATADGVIPEVVDPNSVTDIQAKKDTITFRVKTYYHGDEENIREMKLTYIEGDWKFDELV